MIFRKFSEIRDLITSSESTVYQIIELLERTKRGFVLVADRDGKLVGTVTDGDVRRFALTHRSFQEPCTQVMCRNPVLARAGIQETEIRALLRKTGGKAIPLADAEGRVQGVYEDVPESSVGTGAHRVAVIMAGGEGTRLRPLTEKIPKPMVVVGDRPILEDIVLKLKASGFGKIYLAVNYMAEVIEQHFGDGTRFGVSIEYLRESKKLGTAGALSLMPKDAITSPILLMNGDVMTEVDFAKLFEFHDRRRSALTVAAARYHIQIPYGVLELAGHHVLGVQEKPSHHFLCNAGIYVIDPDLFRFIPHDEIYNMTELLQDANEEGLPVSAFPIHEGWIDIGMTQDLMRAQESMKEKG